MSGLARVLVTEAEFLRLPESMGRAELIDGEVCLAPSPSFWHQELLARVAGSLRDWALSQERPVTVGLAPLDVQLGADRIVQPDAFVVDGTIARDHQGPIRQIPKLCVEVLSTNRVHDRVFKRMLYAEAGVAELWLVEPDGSVERFSGDGLALAMFFQDRLVSLVLGGFELDLAKLR